MLTAIAIAVAAAMGVAVGLLPIAPGLVVALALPVLLVSLRDPRVPLVLLIFSIPYSSLTKVGGGTYSVTATDGLVALLLLSWLGRRIIDRRVPLRSGPTLTALMLLTTAALLSTLTAEDFVGALKEVIKLAEMIVVGLYAASELERPADTRLAVTAMLIAGASEATVGLVQFATSRGPDAFAIGPFMRAYGNFEQPNALAGYLGLLLPLGIAFAFREAPERPVIIVATAIIGAAIFATLSRGSWVGITLGLALTALVWGERSRRALAGGLALGLVGLLLTISGAVPRAISDRMTILFENFALFDVTKVEATPENWALLERMAHWQAGWAMALDYPITGVGPGNYEAAYPRYFLPGWVEPLGHAHNFYVNTFAELGIIGLLSLLGFCAAIFFRIRTGVRAAQQPGSVRRALVLGALGAMVTFAVHNVFDNMLVHGIGVQVALILGLLEAGFAPSAPRATVQHPRPSLVDAAREA